MTLQQNTDAGIGRTVAELEQSLQAAVAERDELLRQQAATADILKAINASSGDLTPVFDVILEKAHSLCDVASGSLQLYDGDDVRTVAMRGFNERWGHYLRKGYRIDDTNREVMETVRPRHVADMRETLDRPANPLSRAFVEIGGFRTFLGLPLIKDGKAIGRIVAARKEVRPFTDHQIALLQSFADQAVVAIENARLLRELRERTDDLSQSLDDLRTAQDRLVQTEKLASLGQLTAGIAHEIKNPLNFVNNFSALSAELVDELNDALKPAALDGKTRVVIDELTRMLKGNLEKVSQHGRRADSIVKNMLLHSREGSGEHRPADINAIIDESLNLAYHGARAEKANFHIALQRNFDSTAGMIDVFPQEITRVLLNMISNGFYAVTKRKEVGEQGFEPMLRASTKNLGNAVEIRIRDNGTGIPIEVKEKMFDPFFTTKPAGEGTGLGLSMSHDIVVKQHGGKIDVDTEPGAFTEFIITLPRNAVAQIQAGGTN